MVRPAAHCSAELDLQTVRALSGVHPSQRSQMDVAPLAMQKPHDGKLVCRSSRYATSLRPILPIPAASSSVNEHAFYMLATASRKWVTATWPGTAATRAGRTLDAKTCVHDADNLNADKDAVSRMRWP